MAVGLPALYMALAVQAGSHPPAGEKSAQQQANSKSTCGFCARACQTLDCEAPEATRASSFEELSHKGTWFRCALRRYTPTVVRVNSTQPACKVSCWQVALGIRRLGSGLGKDLKTVRTVLQHRNSALQHIGLRDHTPSSGNRDDLNLPLPTPA